MSKQVIKDVLVRIGADPTALENALNSSLSSLKGWSLAGAAAVGAVTGAMVAFTASAVKSAAQIENLARVSNAGTTEFQKMAAAAKIFGVEQDKVADILKDVNDRVGDFLSTGAGPMADFFEQIAPQVGVTADQFRRLSGPEALQLYVSSLQKAGVNQQQMVFYMEAMSSESSRLLPLLMNNGQALREAGDAAQRLGAILSEETLEQLRSARESMVEVEQAFVGFGNQIVTAVAPALAVFADELADVLTNNEEVRSAVSSLASAFGSLTASLSDPATVSALVQALGVFISVADGAISVLTGIIGNIEAATIAFAALGTAIWVAGGPISWIVGLFVAAGAGAITMANNYGVAEQAAYDVAAAEAALRGELEGFATSSGPAARAESRARVISLKEHAAAALAAAQAELALASAQQEQRLAEAPDWIKDANAAGVLNTKEYDAAIGKVKELEAHLRDLTASLKDLDASGGSSTTVSPTIIPDPNNGSGTVYDPALSGSGAAGGGGENPWAARLDSLVNQIAAEKEVLQTWYTESQEILRAAREQELLTQEEFNQRSVELNKKYQDQMRTIDRRAWNERASAWSGALGDLASLMQSGNKKMFDIGKAAAIAQATIDGWSAATSAWEKGMKIGGPPVAAAFTAFSLVRTGAMIASIASQQFGGGSNATASGGGSGSVPQAEAGPTGYSTFIIQGDTIGRQTGGELIREVNSAIEAGHRINMEWQPAGALG